MLQELITNTSNLYQTLYETGQKLLKDAIKQRETTESTAPPPQDDKAIVSQFADFEPFLQERTILSETIEIAACAIQDSLGSSKFLGEITQATICQYNLDKTLLYKITENYLDKNGLLQKIDYFTTSEELLT